MDPIAAQLIARLQSDPSDRDAYDALKAHYLHAGDLASLANLLEGFADLVVDDWQTASDAYVESADAVLQSSGDRQRAKMLYRKALARNTLQPRVADGLRALLEESEEYRDVAELLDGYATALQAAGGAPGDVATLYRQLGKLWQGPLGRPDVAADYLARAAQASGEPAGASAAEPTPGTSNGTAPALRGGAEIEAFDARGPSDSPGAAGASMRPADAGQLAEQYEEHATAEQDPERKAVLLSQLAELRAEQLGDLEGAIQALRQALSVAPGDVAIMHQLASCLLSRAQATDPEAAGPDHRRAAELFYQIAQGVDETQAIAYLTSALNSVPDHEGALTLLERLAPAQGSSELLPQYWVNYIAAASPGPEVDQRRLLLGQAYLESGQLGDASYCLQPAAEHGNERAHELLQQVYARQAHAGESTPGEDTAPTDEPEPNALPAARPAPELDDTRAQTLSKVALLRKQLHEALAARRNDEAAEHCRALLEIDPNDPEAFNLLESHCRKRRDYAGLRDLLLASTRMPGLPVDARKVRLREVATLSESKLRDSEAAVSAWRGVSTLDPSDREALSSLKRLLTKAQQWDELASVLEREALATTTVDEKAQLIREIALLHRDRRKDRVETAEAFRQLYALKPGDAAVRDELCDLLVELEQWHDAVPLFRERIAASKDDVDKLKWNALLASVLHDKLMDFDAAFAACVEILALRPSDKATLDRMERIDEQSENYARLLSTLKRRAQLAAKAERPALFLHMGAIAEQHLHDIDKAAEYFGDALDLAPDNQEALAHLVEMFERAERYDQLVELLRERCLLDKDPKSRALLHRRIAQALAEHLDDADGAAAAYRSLLEIEEDEPALRFLRDFAVRKDDANALASMLKRLAAIVQDTGERRDLWFDLAVVLNDRLSQPKEAVAALERILAEVDPAFEPAIDLLLSISEDSDDKPGIALALERRLALLRDPVERLALAKRLADLCERELNDSKRAIAALTCWSADDTQNTEPRRRLRPLLTAAGDWPALLATLDALSEWEEDFEARDEATISASRVAFERMNDSQAAWRRLLPLVEERNEEAERLLRDVAKRGSLLRELSALYVQLAQQSEDSALQAVYWRSAADIFEHELQDAAQALEAGLRMLATDLGNREFLAHVDGLAVKTKAFRRMSQVYDRMLKQAQDDSEKVELLKRHADLLESDQEDEALDRILRACALAPHDEKLLERAEALAQRTGRSEELLVVYDRRRAKSEDDESKVRLLLRAARLCDGALRDRERANAYLQSALGVAGASARLGAEVERTARDLDGARPDLGVDQARRALIAAHRAVAERAEPAAATRLLLRGADLLQHELGDERAAFDMLREGVALAQKSDEVYAALLVAGDKLKRLDMVDLQLARLIDEAIDSATAVVLLRRRGALLEGPLNRHQDAAAVYTKLLQLRPDDADATHKLRASLRQSGRHQDLLLALNKQLQRTRDSEQRLLLLKEAAVCWELGLKNRWEALDAWKAVLRHAPDDADATSAVRRLERGRGSSPDPLLQDDEESGPSDQAESARDAARIESAPDVSPDASAEARAAEPVTATATASDEPAAEEPPTSPMSRPPAVSSVPAPIAALLDELDASAPEPQAAETTQVETDHRADALDQPVVASAEFEPAVSAADSPTAPALRGGASSTAPALRGGASVLDARDTMRDEFEDDSGGLDALDAAMASSPRRIEELDAFEDVDTVAVDVEIDVPPPAVSSARPALPPLASARPGLPPLASARPGLPSLASARPALPPRPSEGRALPAPPGGRTVPPVVSRPPPLPPHGRNSGVPAPAATTHAGTTSPGTRGSVPPPLPGARTSSPPPPLPGRESSRPPPLPSQRKPE